MNITATNKNLSWRHHDGRSDKCPCCTFNVEIAEHVLLCPEVGRVGHCFCWWEVHCALDFVKHKSNHFLPRVEVAISLCQLLNRNRFFAIFVLCEQRGGGGELHGCHELLPVGWWGCARHPWIGWLHNRSCPHTLEGAWWVSALSTLSSGVRAWSHPSSQFQSLPTQRLEDIGFQPLRYVGKGPCRQWEDDVNRQEEVGVRERGCGTKQCLVVSLSTWQG